MPIRIAIVGYGKIAKDQHVPSIIADPRFELVAISTRSRDHGSGLPCYPEPEKLFTEFGGRLDAVAICTPPVVRHAIARDALRAGLHVLLEKPPAATLGEIEHLGGIARETGRTLYTGWHSQHAAGVARAAEALAGAKVAKLHISWLEDVRKWHPGQEWIWAPGGFGVFDPGVNALSIATRILPEPLFVREASLLFPENKQAPIAATLTFAGDDMRAEMDWRFTEGEQWTIRAETDAGRTVELRDGGARLFIDGVQQEVGEHGEYPSIYNRFAELIESGASEVDREPLRIVADAFMVGRRELTEPFA
ncbi:MAG: gfo/Idh/MocA family oxidoreductase [Alphaproteobacteria bacterium]|jgi:D-galactose 1-dehydrogenase|nr:gfo/Idh/MocA family oxidoreductase [Alphaproteobacteria bacterium]